LFKLKMNWSQIITPKMEDIVVIAREMIDTKVLYM
jgi:hypothetical protein